MNFSAYTAGFDDGRMNGGPTPNLDDILKHIGSPSEKIYGFLENGTQVPLYEWNEINNEWISRNLKYELDLPNGGTPVLYISVFEELSKSDYSMEQFLDFFAAIEILEAVTKPGTSVVFNNLTIDDVIIHQASYLTEGFMPALNFSDIKQGYMGTYTNKAKIKINLVTYGYRSMYDARKKFVALGECAICEISTRV